MLACMLHVPLAAGLILLASCAGTGAATAVSFTTAGPQGQAQPPVLELPRHPALSPDGSQVAFTHQGDVWVASVDTGLAMRLTAHGSMDAAPYWSPDGSELAFLSNRHGNYDIYLMPAWGGAPERVTWDSGNDQLHGWLDGDRVLLGRSADRRYLRGEVGAWIGYRDGRTPTLLGDWGMMNPELSRDERWLVYERGHSDPARRAYRGAATSNLWVCDLQSGEHRALTEFDGSDIYPMISPDAGTVYFLSDRACAGNEGGRDLGLWKIALAGGEPQLVYHPGGRSLRTAGLSGDGRTVVAELDAGLVLVETRSGQARPLEVRGSFDPSEPRSYERTVDSGASGLAVSPDGESIAFEAGGDIYVLRKHEDIRRCERVSTAPEPDYGPVWAEDGKALLFLSERDGNAEVYRARPQSEDEPFYRASGFTIERLTETAEDESGLTLSPDGESAAWVVGAGRLVIGDPATLAERRTVVDGFEAPDYDWSPDSAWLAYSHVDDDFNYDVFLARVAIEGLDPAEPGVTPYNLTRHPDDDTGPRWSPDGRKLSFTSRRMMLDETDVWVAWLRAEDLERNKRERLEYEEEQGKAKKAKQDEPKPAAEAVTDPVSGTWRGSASMPEIGEVPVSLTLRLGADGAVSGTATSPMYDGPIESGGWDAETATLTLIVVPAEGVTLTVIATIDGDVMEGSTDAPEGKVTFRMTREAAEAAAAADAGQAPADEAGQEEAAAEKPEKKKPEVDPVVIDFEDLGRRVMRVTRREGNEDALGWSADSEKVYFNATVGTRLTPDASAESGCFTVDVREGDEDRVEGSPVSSFTRAGKDVYYVSGGRIKSGSKSYPFAVTFREDRRALRQAVLEQGWRVLDRMFYDAGFHGHDWAASLEKWRPLALAASTSEDYAAMANWMLGEMNASHMGFYGQGRTRAAEIDGQSTGRLGVLWDEAYEGPGRRVAAVLPGTPAARSISALQVGDVVLSVNGTAYAAGDNWARLMLGTAGEETFLAVRDAEGAEREVVIRPSGSLSGALYRRDVEAARAHVEESSGGRLGYVHIEGMSTDSLLDFERELYAAGYGRDALLIDVRENGGGWTTDMLLAMLMVEDHAITVPRGGGEGYPQERRIFATWDKPIVVLCNENSYSNAEIFSWAIKTLGRGPIVGKQTYGAVISTGGAGLLDGSFVRVPFRGWYVNDAQKTNMELNGCPPDYPVENLPGDFAQGLDRQLDKAVEVGLELLD